jgi:formylglycine-generating enzyme required for sulfatase activity
MKKMTASPLYSFSSEWTYLPQTLQEIKETEVAAKAPAGTVYVPKNEQWNFSVSGVEIEGDDAHGVDVQYPWESHPQREHSHTMSVGPFYMDRFPVTALNYSAFLEDTGFQPKDDYRWLKNWNGSHTPPAGVEDLPVTYISLDEARAFCKWRGARLPHSYEWQYAAQGNDGRMYPWGSKKDQSKFPVMGQMHDYPGPEPIGRYPDGASPFGVEGLVGNVWQYTDEFYDDHTRAVLLRGSSNYYPTGSHWYFPHALELNTHNKYFLMDDRYERAGTVGFRCVVDAQ